ncbi:hypothetical protein OY671_007696, partial [Metschnikowia pulcherrima]
STLKAILSLGLAICNFQKQRGLSRRFNELDDFEGKFPPASHFRRFRESKAFAARFCERTGVPPEDFRLAVRQCRHNPPVMRETVGRRPDGLHIAGLPSRLPGLAEPVEPSLRSLGLADCVRFDRAARCQELSVPIERRHGQSLSHSVDRLACFEQIVDKRRRGITRYAIRIVPEQAPLACGGDAQGLDQRLRVVRLEFGTTVIKPIQSISSGHAPARTRYNGWRQCRRQLAERVEWHLSGAAFSAPGRDSPELWAVHHSLPSSQPMANPHASIYASRRPSRRRAQPCRRSVRQSPGSKMMTVGCPLATWAGVYVLYGKLRERCKGRCARRINQRSLSTRR